MEMEIEMERESERPHYQGIKLEFDRPLAFYGIKIIY